MTSLIDYPFFSLVQDESQAEAALAAISCFGNDNEKQYFKPLALQIKRELLHTKNNVCLVEKVNNLIASYVKQCGELSDQLIIFISKSILH